ncbi:hypothetical protein LCGC14_1841140, partial [marine sediment metagenome]
ALDGRGDGHDLLLGLLPCVHYPEDANVRVLAYLTLYKVTDCGGLVGIRRTDDDGAVTSFKGLSPGILIELVFTVVYGLGIGTSITVPCSHSTDG